LDEAQGIVVAVLLHVAMLLASAGAGAAARSCPGTATRC